MNVRRVQTAKSARSAASRQAKRRNASIRSHAVLQRPKQARRSSTGQQNCSEPFAPPEDWYEPTAASNYRIIVQQPGRGYRHVVTPDQVRERLALVPQRFLKNLEVVQFSRMTRKKQWFPCYGMQWGNALYLYPIEESFVEQFDTPPRPNLVNESQMYGGRWDEQSPGTWTLTWSQQAAEDFYLNNILIHELGHLVDDRNSGYLERERYAEWFAIEYGYLHSGGRAARNYHQPTTRRRHHK
ncbi:MAG: hypothetical protein IT425_03330 [Pirellulales bacterium]|nr:hypothetical protein [Pirellulales bacterium]